ncbi:unnamed protein product [Orchesella dallaii]|uniref:DRBM domain-containing protein n=1 Tax=Orchesella dallaii TaxID=48710 RepID=A0ABP1PXH6_9HEXA
MDKNTKIPVTKPEVLSRTIFNEHAGTANETVPDREMESDTESYFADWEKESDASGISMSCVADSLDGYQALIGFPNKRVTVNQDGLLQIIEEDVLPVSGSSTISIRLDPVDRLENVYKLRRDDIVAKNGFILTPLHIIKVIATKYKEPIHIEHYVLKNPTATKIIYRVDILVGNLRGVGQCTRKQLARQLAAMDLLEQIQVSEAESHKKLWKNLDPNGLLPGWRVDQMVYLVFKDVCKEYGFSGPVFTFKAKEHELGKCKITCRIGNMVSQGESDLPWLAKKLAVKEMIEIITNEQYRLEGTLMGNHVLGFPEMRLLGFKPKISGIKRKWIKEHRIKDTQIVFSDNEPNDGEMDDLEKQFQDESSKLMKAEVAKANLRITVQNEGETNPPSASFGVTAPM